MLHRHDVSDKGWEKINKNLPGSEGYTGRNGVDNRKFINAVFWILRTGAPWRDLPKEYGDWKNTHRRFTRWRDKGIWEKVLKSGNCLQVVECGRGEGSVYGKADGGLQVELQTGLR